MALKDCISVVCIFLYWFLCVRFAIYRILLVYPNFTFYCHILILKHSIAQASCLFRRFISLSLYLFSQSTITWDFCFQVVEAYDIRCCPFWFLDFWKTLYYHIYYQIGDCCFAYLFLFFINQKKEKIIWLSLMLIFP